MFIFRTISQPRTLSADIPAAGRGLFTKYTCNIKYGQNFPSKLAAIKNRPAAELTSRYSGTGPKYKWNSSLHCSECFRMTKVSATIVISNSNWSEWSTIQGVIERVISKSAEREARGRFEITSTITTWIVRQEVQLLINRNYNKIREEYGSGLNYLTGLYIQLLSYMPKKKAIQARAWWRVLSNYSGMTRTTVQLQAHDVCNCPITAEIRPADDQSDSRILI